MRRGGHGGGDGGSQARTRFGQERGDRDTGRGYARGEREDRPVYADDRRDERPVYGDGPRRERPVHAEDARDERPVYADETRDEAPVYARDQREQRPVYAEEDREAAPPYAPGPDRERAYGDRWASRQDVSGYCDTQRFDGLRRAVRRALQVGALDWRAARDMEDEIDNDQDVQNSYCASGMNGWRAHRLDAQYSQIEDRLRIERAR